MLTNSFVKKFNKVFNKFCSNMNKKQTSFYDDNLNNNILT